MRQTDVSHGFVLFLLCFRIRFFYLWFGLVHLICLEFEFQQILFLHIYSIDRDAIINGNILYLFCQKKNRDKKWLNFSQFSFFQLYGSPVGLFCYFLLLNLQIFQYTIRYVFFMCECVCECIASIYFDVFFPSFFDNFLLCVFFCSLPLLINW